MKKILLFLMMVIIVSCKGISLEKQEILSQKEYNHQDICCESIDIKHIPIDSDSEVYAVEVIYKALFEDKNQKYTLEITRLDFTINSNDTICFFVKYDLKDSFIIQIVNPPFTLDELKKTGTALRLLLLYDYKSGDYTPTKEKLMKHFSLVGQANRFFFFTMKTSECDSTRKVVSFHKHDLITGLQISGTNDIITDVDMPYAKAVAQNMTNNEFMNVFYSRSRFKTSPYKLFDILYSILKPEYYPQTTGFTTLSSEIIDSLDKKYLKENHEKWVLKRPLFYPPNSKVESTLKKTGSEKKRFFGIDELNRSAK